MSPRYEHPLTDVSCIMLANAAPLLLLPRSCRFFVCFVCIEEDMTPLPPCSISVHKGMMSKKRSKATVTVRGMQVILKEKDEKKEREKDELMERMQRRMGMGCGASSGDFP